MTRYVALGAALVLAQWLGTPLSWGAGTPKAATNLRTDGTPANECTQMKPDWIFCSGFEEGNKSIWDNVSPMPDDTHTLMEDPGPKNIAGNHVIRLRPPPGARTGADLVKLMPQSYDRLYARWYIKWEPGYNLTAHNHGGGLHAGSRWNLGRSDVRPNGDDWFSSWIEPINTSAYGEPYGPALNAYTYYRGMYQDCADPNGACWGDHFPCMLGDSNTGYCKSPEDREKVPPPKLVTNRWYCIEMMMDGGTPTSSQTGANGVLDFWVDGVEAGPWTNLWFRTVPELKLTLLWLSLYFHETHTVEGIMFDNVVVSKSKVGCL